MNYETFKSSAVTSIQNYFGENTSVSLHPIIKNNDIRLDGLLIQDHHPYNLSESLLRRISFRKASIIRLRGHHPCLSE